MARSQLCFNAFAFQRDTFLVNNSTGFYLGIQKPESLSTVTGQGNGARKANGLGKTFGKDVQGGRTITSVRVLENFVVSAWININSHQLNLKPWFDLGCTLRWPTSLEGEGSFVGKSPTNTHTCLVTLKILSRRSERSTLTPKDVPGIIWP